MDRFVQIVECYKILMLKEPGSNGCVRIKMRKCMFCLVFELSCFAKLAIQSHPVEL